MRPPLARPSALLDRRPAPRGLFGWFAPLGNVFRPPVPASREARATAAAKAAEAELYQLFCTSLSVQRDLGANFIDLGESRLAAAHGLRRWTVSGDDSPASVRLAASRALRLVQDYPFSFTSTMAGPSPTRRGAEDAARSTMSEPQAPFPELAVRSAGVPGSPESCLAWARHYTLAYPDVPAPLARLASVADTALRGPGAPKRPLGAPFTAMAERLGHAQQHAWTVRRALEAADPRVG